MLKNLLPAILLSGLLVISCGSSDEGSSSEEEGPKYFEIMNAEKTYSMDDIKNAGLKGIKEFKTDAVVDKTGELVTPGATEIVLGFLKDLQERY